MKFPAGFDAEDFLQNYWQRKPLLIRGDGEAFVDPISPEELAGLACEDFIESRLIRYQPQDATALEQISAGQWSLQRGPFREEEFLQLPQSNYSLLVQAVDQWHEDVRAMLQAFSFIPSWRIDDIMVSYSTDGGNVGPHFDYYDVFLVQGMGQKKWRIGAPADSQSQLLANRDLRLLAAFESEHEWILGPGDILYLPPMLAHWGTALGSSLTYSVGFRAPSHSEIIAGVSDVIMERLPEDQRYLDTLPQRPERSGEIPQRVVSQLQEVLLAQLMQPELLSSWFGASMTSPKYPDIGVIVEEELTGEDLQQELQSGSRLFKNPAARFAFFESGDKLQLFVDGIEFACTAADMPLIELLCAAGDLPADLETKAGAWCELLAALYNQGSLLLDDAQEEAE